VIHGVPAAVMRDIAAVEQLATNWWGIVSLIVIYLAAPAILGLVTVWQSSKIRDRVGGVQASVNETNEQVGHVQDHVANGHPTLLRNDLTEALSMMRLTTEYVRQLPNRDDLRRIESKVDALERRFRETGK
jgi:hypothetical protein